MPLDSLARTMNLLMVSQTIDDYLLSLNSAGYIAAMYLADNSALATPGGGFSGTILKNAGYTGGVGAELVSNGDFSAWTAGDPDSWSVIESPPNSEIRESGSGGQCVLENVSASPIIFQAILTAGITYKVTLDVISITGGTLRVRDNGSGLQQDITTAGSYTIYGIAAAGQLQISQVSAGTATIDNVSCKKVGQLDAQIGGTTTWLAGGGLSFDGATSYARVLNNAALANLTGQMAVFIGTPTSLGESDIGAHIAWASGASPNWIIFFNSTNRIRSYYFTDGTSPAATSNNNQVDWIGSKALVAMVFDDSNILGAGRHISILRGLNGVLSTLSLGTDIAATGTFQAPTGDLYFGNGASATLTYDGTINKVILFNDNAIADYTNILTNLTKLAGV